MHIPRVARNPDFALPRRRRDLPRSPCSPDTGELGWGAWATPLDDAEARVSLPAACRVCRLAVELAEPKSWTNELAGRRRSDLKATRAALIIRRVGERPEDSPRRAGPSAQVLLPEPLAGRWV